MVRPVAAYLNDRNHREWMHGDYVLAAESFCAAAHLGCNPLYVTGIGPKYGGMQPYRNRISPNDETGKVA